MPKNGLFQKNPNRRGEEEGRGEDIFFWKKSLECLASYVTNLRNFTAEKPSFYPFSLSDPWNFHIMMLFLFKIPLPGNSIACPNFLINSPPAWTFSGISAKPNQRKQLHWDQACLLELHVTECAWSMLLHISTCTYVFSFWAFKGTHPYPTCHARETSIWRFFFIPTQSL